MIYLRNNNIYNVRAKSDFSIPQVKTAWKGSKSIRYYGPVIWNLILAEIKYVDSFLKVKQECGKPITALVEFIKTISLMLDFLKHFNKA